MASSPSLIRLADGFWNLRGRFRIAGILDVGTQMSLVRRADGRFLLLDSYPLMSEAREQLLSLTDGGKKVEAILNLHPFHTLHCAAIPHLFPNARLIGTRRHREKWPALRWDERTSDDPALWADYAEDLDFTIPSGVDFISANESVHVASVLVRHRSSGIVHVDDTLNLFKPPRWLAPVFPEPKLRFHPGLPKALETRPGSADDFAGWASRLADDWAETRIVCTAHWAVRQLRPGGWKTEILAALARVERILDAHRERHG